VEERADRKKGQPTMVSDGGEDDEVTGGVIQLNAEQRRAIEQDELLLEIYRLEVRIPSCILLFAILLKNSMASSYCLMSEISLCYISASAWLPFVFELFFPNMSFRCISSTEQQAPACCEDD
jgi:hypothetical protein